MVAQELTLRAWISGVLQDARIPASFAAGRQEGLRLVREVGSPSVLITNMDLGEWLDGFNLAETLRESTPDLATIFLKGNRPYHQTVTLGRQDCVLSEQCGPDVFLAAVRRMAPAWLG